MPQPDATAGVLLPSYLHDCSAAPTFLLHNSNLLVTYLRHSCYTQLQRYSYCTGLVPTHLLNARSAPAHLLKARFVPAQIHSKQAPRPPTWP